MTFNAMISMYKKAGKLEKAEKLFTLMTQVGPEPDHMTYLTVVDMYAKAKKVKEAEEVVKDMMDKGKFAREGLS